MKAPAETEHRAPAAAKLSARESELLDITLSVLHESGYDRLTVDEVAARARASKATLYRRWPTKADLVIAAFTAGIRQAAGPPSTGNLRDDLIQVGEVIRLQGCRFGPAISGIMSEIHRSPKLRDAFEEKFYHERRALIMGVLQAAVDRGEISTTAVNTEIWDLLPGYLVFRCLAPGHPPTTETVRALVDEVLMPSLTRGGDAAADKDAAVTAGRSVPGARRPGR